MKRIVNKKPFMLSSVYDETLENKTITYKFFVKYDDTYTFYCETASLLVYNSDFSYKLKKKEKLELSLQKDSLLKIKVKTKNTKESFVLNVIPNNKTIPSYDINHTDTLQDVSLYNDKYDSLTPAEIKVNKRKGGSYIYSNVPESMPLEVVNSIIMENKNLKGQCFVTFEHQNTTGLPYVYLGYRLINNNEKDIYVTIKNIGYQVKDSWLGEKSWMDYYGVKYPMDIVKTFNEEKYKWFHDYLNFDTNYTPNPIVPSTYKIPKGKYIYVIGGTTLDSYNNINVNSTADLKISPRCCANGNVLFNIYGKNVTGQLCVCDNPESIINKDLVIQNMRRYGEHDDYGGRMGISNHEGVIDTDINFVFNDLTASQNLPVKYYPLYADTLKEKYRPKEKIKGLYRHEVNNDRWYTHLSSQFHHEYVGDDMVENVSVWKNKPIKFSTFIANPAGNIWDFGNWMIEYHDNFTFVNQGDKNRKIRFTLHNLGSIFYIFKDENGNIIHSGATFHSCTGKIPCHEIDVFPHSKVFVSLQYVLPANNNGSIEHIVELV